MAQLDHISDGHIGGGTIARPDWLPEAEWPFELRAVEIDGHRVHFVDEGSGPVLLFVHAGMWSFLWRDVMLRLREDFRCVALDFPGSGLSEARPGYRPTLSGHSRILEKVVDALGLNDATLVVHDLGGPIGLSFAARRADLIRGIVVSQAFAWIPGAGLRGMLRLMGSGGMRRFMSRTNLLMRGTSMRFGAGRNWESGARRAFLGPMRERARRAVPHQLMRDASRNMTLLAAITDGIERSLADREVLMIFGARNDPGRFRKRWKALYPSVRDVVVPKGYHFPMTDDPELFAQSIRSWRHERLT